MKHLYNNRPSIGWMRAALKRYRNQRVTFVLNKNYWSWIKPYQQESWLKDGIDVTKPVTVNGVFKEVWYRSDDWHKHGWVRPDPKALKTFVFEFRDVIFCQGPADDYHTFKFWQNSESNKRHTWGFKLADINWTKLVEMKEQVKSLCLPPMN